MNEHINSLLVEARKKKGLSQRALSKKLNKPQSYISKMENGLVDIQLSTLIEVSRTLELEVMLIPREYIVMVKAMISDQKSDEQIPMFMLEEEEDE